MRHPLRLPALAAVALLSACASTKPHVFVCPAKGGPAWREVTTEHFVLQTDLGSAEAGRLARELEGMRAAVLLALFRSPPPIPGRVRVVAFRHPAEFHLFAPAGARAFFTSSDLSEPLVALPAPYGSAHEAVLAHELAHYVANWVFPRQPRWFAEGIAALVEPLADKGIETRPTVGKITGSRIAGARRRHVDARELLAWDGSATDSGFHDWSAVLVQYLLSQESAGFVELQRRFARAQDPGAAWREVFPQWDPDRPGAIERLDAILRDHVQNGRWTARVVDPKISAESSERPLAAGEVHAIRLALARGEGASEALLKEAHRSLIGEIDEALAEDPAHPLALRARTELDGGDARPVARRAAERNPGDVRAWLWLADVL
jgi:hypothetical protein